MLDLYPLPELASFKDQIAESCIFSKVDLTKAFHQLLIHKDDRKYTAVNTQWGMFQFRRLSMGLQNSGQSFQRLVDSVLKDIPGSFCYLDDILVYHKSKSDHLKTLEVIFERLSKAGLSINLSKCEFGVPKLDYLGYTIDKEGLRPIEKKVDAIQNFPEPLKQKQLLGFLGALNYYRASLPSLEPVDSNSKARTPVEVLDPLYKLATCQIPKKVKFVDVWNNSKIVQQSFKDAKRLLQMAVTLNYPRPNAPLALTTDASKLSLGATLDQWVDGSWRPLGMWSKALKPVQQGYTTYKRELLAIKLGLRHFNKDINGRRLCIFTDHRPLIGSFASPDLQAHDPQALNAINEIAQWTSDIRHKPGRDIPIADWLSRVKNQPIAADTDFAALCTNNLPKNREIQTRLPVVPAAQIDSAPSYVSSDLTLAALEEVGLQTLNPAKMAEEQMLCNDVMNHLAGNKPKNVTIDKIDIFGTKLVCETSDPKNPRPMVPISQRNLVINLLHHGDHPGIKETLRRVTSDYYWPKLRQEVTAFCKSCHPCQIAKQSTTVKPGIGDFEVPDKRFQFIHLDIVGPLPVSEGKRYILTVLDRCSRWLECYPLSHDSAEEVCKGFMQWVARYGLPGVAYSDQGNAFTANLFQDILKTFNIEIKFSPAYYAANNGAIERKHQDLKNALKASLVDMGNFHRDKWMTALPWVLLGRRVAFQPHLDASAAQMVLGMSPRIPGQLLSHPGPPLNTIQLKGLLDQLYRMHDRPPVQTSGKREILDIENTTTATHVYVKVDNPASLCPKFEGPYEIYSRPSRSQVEVKLGVFKDNRPRLLTFHWSSCKVANMRDGSKPASRPKLGRPPKTSVPVEPPEPTEGSSTPLPANPPASSTGFPSSEVDSHNSPSNVNNDADIQFSAGNRQQTADSNIQIAAGNRRQVRSTRNQAPNYVF